MSLIDGMYPTDKPADVSARDSMQVIDTYSWCVQRESERGREGGMEGEKRITLDHHQRKRRNVTRIAVCIVDEAANGLWRPAFE